MDIVFIANNNEIIHILPIVPPGIPIDSPRKNEVFDSMNRGEFKLIGHMGLKTVSISSFFPNRYYPFIKKGASTRAKDYIDFFEEWSDKKAPIRIVMTTKNGEEVLNLPVVVDNFNHSYDKVGDVNYTLDLSEYNFVEV